MWVIHLSLPSPYVELVNILLSCGEEVKEALTRSVRLQCEQNWGALCDSLSLCSSLVPSPASSVAAHHHHHHHHPFPSPHLEPGHQRLPRPGDKDRAGRAALNAHPRNRSQGPRRHSPEPAVVTDHEDPKAGIRRWKLKRTLYPFQHVKATFVDLCTHPCHQTNTHVYTHTCIHAHMHTQTHANTHTYMVLHDPKLPDRLSRRK